MHFSFIQISDHHLTPTEADLLNGFSTRYAFRAVLKHIAQHAARRADFIISTGDLVENPDAASYGAFRQLLGVQNAGAPAPGPLSITLDGGQPFALYLLPGNHDDRRNFFTCLFPDHPPAPLANAVFVHKGVQFVCLDWGRRAKAVASPAMLDFLAAALATDLPSVLLMHHQVTPIGSRWLDDFIADDVQRFWEVIAGRKVLAVCCGHVHTSSEQIVNGVPVLSLRSTAFPFVLQDEPLGCLLPPHYRLVTLQDGVLSSEIFEVPL